MRSSYIPLSLLVCHALVGCTDDAAPDDAVDDAVQGVAGDAVDARARPATIHITSEFPPALVVVREGLHGRWRPARQITATTFEAKVHGPYVVTVVCAEHPIFFDFNETLTWQVARTPEDSRDLSFCDLFPPHTATGHMVQAGFVQMGENGGRSTTPDWDFSIPVPTGSLDLIATSADAIAVRRGIPVDGDVAVTPDVDLAQEGTALVNVAFRASNATPDETTLVSVGLFTQTTTFLPARVFLGPLDAAKAAPDAALIASDVQSVSVRASTDTTLRALRRPFRVGGDTVFTLPPPLGPVTWDVVDGKIAVHWTTLPPFTVFSEFIGGSALFPLTPPSYLTELSPRFIAATRIHRFQIDTDIPGFQPAWRVDFTDFYSRDLSVQNLPEPRVVITSNVSELIDPAQPQLAPGARATVAPSTAPIRRTPRAMQP